MVGTVKSIKPITLRASLLMSMLSSPRFTHLPYLIVDLSKLTYKQPEIIRFSPFQSSHPATRCTSAQMRCQNPVLPASRADVLSFQPQRLRYPRTHRPYVMKQAVDI